MNDSLKPTGNSSSNRRKFPISAWDLNHAIQLMSEHPSVKLHPFEIRPVAGLTEMIRESEQRRAEATGE
jgi:hypothetical protein